MDFFKSYYKLNEFGKVYVGSDFDSHHDKSIFEVQILHISTVPSWEKQSIKSLCYLNLPQCKSNEQKNRQWIP